MKRTLPRIFTLLATAALTGCTTVRQSFPDEDPALLWTAIVAVAETPDYGDADDDEGWSIKENHVRIDETDRRVVIYREIVRFKDLSSTRPHRDRREFRFEVLLDELPPPTVSVVSRGTGVPGHARGEAERLLADVDALLAGGASLGTVSPPPGGASSPEVAVRDLLHAVFVRDDAAIRRLIVRPTPEAAVLWQGAPSDPAPAQLERRVIRAVEPGEVVTIDGHPVRVTRALVNRDRALVVATVEGRELAPFVVLRADGRWRVDAAPLIERRRASPP